MHKPSAQSHSQNWVVVLLLMRLVLVVGLKGSMVCCAAGACLRCSSSACWVGLRGEMCCCLLCLDDCFSAAPMALLLLAAADAVASLVEPQRTCQERNCVGSAYVWSTLQMESDGVSVDIIDSLTDQMLGIGWAYTHRISNTGFKEKP